MLAFLEKRGHAGGVKGWQADMKRERDERAAATPEAIAGHRAP
jgi:hypothetical protein